jgi:hypothetical protein
MCPGGTRSVGLVASGLSEDEVAAELAYANGSGARNAVQASLKTVQPGAVK